MNTLHQLRRSRRLSLSQLTELSGISMRRLAELEYEDWPALSFETERLAAVFGVQPQHLAAGSTAALAQRPALLPSQQAYLLAALAASAALTLTLQIEPPQLAPVGRGMPVSAFVAAPTVTVTSTSEPQATSVSAEEAEMLLMALLGIPPTPVAGQVGVPAVPTMTAVPAQPHICPIVPEQGQVVLLGSARRPAQGSALTLAVDADGDGYAEPASTRHAAVVAAHDGVVQVALDTWPGGNQVVLEGREGWRSVYSHLDAIDVKSGQQVAAGALLGQAGNTGQVAGPQLGLEVQQNGLSADASLILNCDS